MVHEKFIEALEALFEKYKHELGFKDTILEIYWRSCGRSILSFSPNDAKW
jgi:predicted nucleic acid-binding protein